MSSIPHSITLPVPEELVEALARRVAALITSARDEAGSPWLTVDEAADYIRVTPHALRKLIQRDLIPSFQPNGSGTRHYFQRDELDEWIRAGRLR